MKNVAKPFPSAGKMNVITKTLPSERPLRPGIPRFEAHHESV